MIKTLLTALSISGMLSFAAQAQTTPAGSAPASNRSAGTMTKSTGKTSQGNSGDMAPNRSSTAGSHNAATSNNPVDATGKPVGATQPTNTTSTVKAGKTKN